MTIKILGTNLYFSTINQQVLQCQEKKVKYLSTSARSKSTKSKKNRYMKNLTVKIVSGRHLQLQPDFVYEQFEWEGCGFSHLPVAPPLTCDR